MTSQNDHRAPLSADAGGQAKQSNSNVTVLIDGAWRQSLSVVRSLGRAGYRVVVIGTPSSSYLESSRYVSSSISPSPSLSLSGGEDRVHEIAAQLGQTTGEVVYYPIGDTEIRFAIEQRACFPTEWRLAMAPLGVVELCADKTKMAKCTEAAGVPGIRTIPVTNLAELKTAAEAIGFPCLVKGNSEAIRHNHRKAFILQRSSEVEGSFAGWAGGDQTMLVQTYCQGPRYNVYFFAHEGEVLASGSLRAVRTDMADGTGLAVEGVSVETTPELLEHTVNLVRKMGYHGAGCAQFLLDDQGQNPVFLEVNARLGANFGAVYRAGLDLPRLSVESALDADVTRDLGSGFSVGRRYSWFYGDLSGCLRSLRRWQVGPIGALVWMGTAVRSLVTADDHITWDRDDPKPTVEIWKQLLLPWRRSATL